ncbi:MAG: hypothetical protein ACE15D_11300 [Candidatus Eisenbacteria bacterium]
MRPLFLLALGILFLVSGASAAEFLTVDHPSYSVETTPQDRLQVYQNYDITTIGDTQVACGVAGSYTTQNWFLRRFFLYDDHGLESFQVESVDFGVSYLSGNMSVTLFLFEIDNGAPFLFANLREVWRTSIDLTPNDVGSTINVQVGYLCVQDGEATDLVVAIDAPSGEADLVSFYPGANDAGAFQDAYIAAPDCGISEPVGVSDIGFPDSQTIFVLNGEDGCGIPPQDEDVACCFDDGSCQVLYDYTCIAMGGEPNPWEYDCDPNPCSPTATSHVSWGQVRGLYR